jgi:MoaA/NifB/PqqE/SkfB family radical SAM enzyme
MQTLFDSGLKAPSPVGEGVGGEANPVLPVKKFNHAGKVNKFPTPMIYGMHKKIIKAGIWINIFLCCLYVVKNPLRIFNTMKKIKKLRDNSRESHSILKYAKVNGKYYYSLNAPGWPSEAFSKYISNNIRKLDSAFVHTTLDTIVFGITKKCGYQCEHCFEWDTLNKPETLDRKDILTIIHSFQDIGVTQVQLSGGEPLNRMGDIIYLLQNIKKGTEVWLYTSGYHLTEERAALLKQEGLTGIIVSLDHWIPELHNAFRGMKNAFEWAEKAVANARRKNLVVCLSLCATRQFISTNNLSQYAELAKRWGISFIQVLEPRAVGHYAEKDISLTDVQINALENFYTKYNYDKVYVDYPSILYHGFYSRRIGCGGGSKHFVYIDTDGDVHNCTFCRNKLFSALHDPIEKNISNMMNSGCSAFMNSPKKH